MQQATGRTPFIYSYPSWFGSVAFTDAALAAYPLFIATYASCASVPTPWKSAVFWQYSDTGTVAGVTGQVDEDRFIGSDGDLSGYTGLVDAGIPDDAGLPPPKGAGCGCRSSSPGAAWPMLVAWLVMRRRKASSHSRTC